MNKPVLVERFTDNGEHSHWDLINADTGEMLWTGELNKCAGCGFKVEIGETCYVCIAINLDTNSA